MGKIKFFCMLILIVGLINGCGSSVYSTSDDIAERTITQIVNAKNNNDENGLVKLFSEEIQENGKIKDEAKQFLNFIEGDVVSVEYESGYTDASVDEEYGNSTEIMAHYTLTTSKKEYVLAFIIYPTADSENIEGVQSLGIQEMEDEKQDTCFAPDYKGIYTVTADNHDEIRALEEEATSED